MYPVQLTGVDGRVYDGRDTVVGDGEGGAGLRHGASEDSGGDGGGGQGQESGLHPCGRRQWTMTKGNYFKVVYKC